MKTETKLTRENARVLVSGFLEVVDRREDDPTPAKLSILEAMRVCREVGEDELACSLMFLASLRDFNLEDVVLQSLYQISRRRARKEGYLP